MDVQNFGYVAGLEHSVQLVRHNLPVASILVFFGKRTAPLVLSMYQAIRSHKPLWQVLDGYVSARSLIETMVTESI